MRLVWNSSANLGSVNPWVGESARGTGRAGKPGIGVLSMNRVSALCAKSGTRGFQGQWTADAQHLAVAHALSKRMGKRRDALLDESKMEASSVGRWPACAPKRRGLMGSAYQVLVVFFSPGKGRVMEPQRVRNR